MSSARVFILLGAINALLSVVFGALGSHSLGLTGGALASWHTATEYQMHHALALVLIGLVDDRWPRTVILWSGVLIQLGILLFSGSLMVRLATGVGAYGSLTPYGGLALLGGWLLLAIGVIRASRRR